MSDRGPMVCQPAGGMLERRAAMGFVPIDERQPRNAGSLLRLERRLNAREKRLTLMVAEADRKADLEDEQKQELASLTWRLSYYRKPAAWLAGWTGLGNVSARASARALSSQEERDETRARLYTYHSPHGSPRDYPRVYS